MVVCYTPMFAALLLSAGAVCRVGDHRAFAPDGTDKLTALAPATFGSATPAAPTIVVRLKPSTPR